MRAKARAVRRNGIASPAEYTASRNAPRPGDPEFAAEVRIAPSVGPTHGVQATAKAAPATIGPPVPARSISASTRHSLLSFVMNRAAMKKTPIAMIRAAEILFRSSRFSFSVLPIAGRGEAEQDEDRREARAEEQAGRQHLRPVGLLELVGRDPGDRRQVAGDQRQDAGGEERREPRGERDEDSDSCCWVVHDP